LGKFRFHVSNTKRRTIRLLTNPIGAYYSITRKLISK